MTAEDSDIEQVMALIRSKQSGQRTLIAIAGPPGSGKSTLANAVVNNLNNSEPGMASLIPMDGYHLDNEALKQMNMLERKGAPETFDVRGLLALISSLKTTNSDVRYPLFDRNQDKTLPDAGILKSGTAIVVIEGNYLLLNTPVWRDLHDMFDATVFLCPPIEVLEKRLVTRWLEHGFSPQAAKQKASDNDLANARLVIDSSISADLILNQTN